MSNTRVFIGGLAFALSDADLTTLASKHGSVTSASVIVDRTGRSRGFGFVTYASADEAAAAIAALDGAEHYGRRLSVSLATPLRRGRSA